MPRDDWRDRDPRNRDDFGQADYSTAYGYDPERRSGFRAVPPDTRTPAADRDYARRMNAGDYPRDVPESRSWTDRAGAFFAGDNRREPEPARRRTRNGPSDRVLWAVIAERLEDERRLDLRDVEVIVDDGEVTLNGLVSRKEDKRRIEDIADIDGVRHVQNNLRVRERGHWSFL